MRAPSTGLLIVLVRLMLLVITVALLAAGCGVQKKAIPSALDTQVIDVTAEPGSAQLPPRSSGVPDDSILEMRQSIARDNGVELASQRWWDFANDRFRWDWFGDPATIRGGSTTTANDPATATILYSAVQADGQALSYDAVSGELRGNPAPAGDASVETEDEWPSTDDVVLLGRQMLDGAEVDVYRLDLNVASGQERSADFGLIYVDAASGLRLREEWLLGSPGDAWVYHLYEYQLMPRTAELEAGLTRQALLDLAAETVAGHLREAAALDFPVWGLPDGAHGLALSGVTILRGDRGVQVRLDYAPEDSVWAPAVSMETTDVRIRTDFPENLLIPREQAVAGATGTDHIDLGMDDTSVRIVLKAGGDPPPEPLDLATLAMELVDARALVR